MQHNNEDKSCSWHNGGSTSSSAETSDQKSQHQSSDRHPTDDVNSSPEKLSIDTSSTEYDYLARSPLLEHEPNLGSSGLPRIRQKPPSRACSLPVTTSPVISQSKSNSSPSSGFTYLQEGTTSPVLEDLYRFPSESLHSYSFAQQSGGLLHNRYSALKRSVDFLRDRFTWAANNAGIANAQARMSGDAEIQSMMDLLARTNLLGNSYGSNHESRLAVGPATGPPNMEGANIFDKAFAEQSSSAGFNVQGDNEQSGELTAKDQPSSPHTDETNIPRTRRLRSAPSSRRVSLKRTYTDVGDISLQNKLMGALTDPPSASDLLPAVTTSSFGLGSSTPGVHTHSSKSSPVVQAVFRTETKSPWTILAANDLACLVFGVTQGEFRKLSFLDLIQKEKRPWLESKLRSASQYPRDDSHGDSGTPKTSHVNTRSLGLGNGVTAQLLSKPPARHKVTHKSQTGNSTYSSTDGVKNHNNPNHLPTKSRGVLLCGDVVPIQKRNGSTGSASLWVMEKRGGLIWVVEEITEHAASIEFDEEGRVVKAQGDTNHIWGRVPVERGTSIFKLLPRVPQSSAPGPEPIPDYSKINELKYFTALTSGGSNIPTTLTTISNPRELRISSFPHVSGMMVLSATTFNIVSANSVFSAALFGYDHPEGSQITDLLPHFDEFLSILTEEDDVPLVDGVVIPEHSFRRARALSILRNRDMNSASILSRPMGLPALHRDGSEITVDVQMRVVRSETIFPVNKENAAELAAEHHHEIADEDNEVAITEVVFALWITYSRQLHSITVQDKPILSKEVLPEETTPSRHSPVQMSPVLSPTEIPIVESPITENKNQILIQKLNEAASEPLTDMPVQPVPEVKVPSTHKDTPTKKSIYDYVILEDMGEGAYGQVKLGRSRRDPSKKVVLKYVTKNRILVDTWTRDRRLGTVPLEIHVLDFLRRDGFRHPNIIEMEGFFEDNINYYIEMIPHGLPGMDLFDYVELKSNMDEAECRSIFRQVVDAIHHLHTKALVVHRDIKDENVILDGEGRIKLIDFGSAAYIKNGPFDVFVGTIDYAAPEVLQGKPYRGKEQDVWALGILLYTIIYKENPFYNINEIMDHPLRIPFLPFSEDCIDLIRKMLDRDVDQRLTITGVIEHPWMQASR